MKNVKYCFVLGALLLLSGACTPIEDDELRDKYVTNAGAPITPEELTAALEVTQPYPNSADATEGDQYIHLKNNRPEIGGVWHVGNKTFQTDDKIVVMEANGVYDIYYTAVSNNAIVSSIPVQVTVTNVFDEWMGFLTGAVDKTDMTAKKTWGFRQGLAAVCDMCAHGYWKYASAGYTPESFAGITWWGAVTYETAGDQTMVFEVDGNKLTTYKADGTQNGEGTFEFTHSGPEESLGLLNTTVPLIGGQYDDLGQGSSNSFYILTLTDQYLTVYHPTVSPGTDWEDSGWRAVYEAK